MTNPTVFISYARENQEHNDWVKELASRLRRDRIDAQLDKWELTLGSQNSAFMNQIKSCKFVLVICTPKYKERSDGRIGGVGYESDLIKAEVALGKDTKIIPVLRTGSWDKSLPEWLKDFNGIDLCGNPFVEDNYLELKNRLLGSLETAPDISVLPTPSDALRDDTADALVNVLTGTNSIARKALMLKSFGDDDITNQIDYSGSSSTFVSHLLHVFIHYGFLANGKPATSELLDYVRRNLLGSDQVEQIERIIEEWNSLYLNSETH